MLNFHIFQPATQFICYDLRKRGFQALTMRCNAERSGNCAGCVDAD
ncbi:Uncharacterised protein [Mycobacterium tuberculosis]|nr:Uncharacterised protein [Mycobacterium tuberculosis]